MEVKDKIRNYRIQNFWTQEELAEKVDVTPNAVSQWETGNAIPRYSTLEKLAKLFGVPTAFLLDEESRMFDMDNVNDINQKIKMIENLPDDIYEFMRIYEDCDNRQKHRLMALVYEFEDSVSNKNN